MIKRLHYESPLAKWVREQKMTQYEFAIRVGVGETMIRRYIAGIATPTGIRLERITKLTGLTGAMLEAGRYTSEK